MILVLFGQIHYDEYKNYMGIWILAQNFDLIITFNHLQSIGLDNLDIAASKFKSKIH